MQLDKKLLRNIFFGVAGCILLYWLLHEPERWLSLISSIGQIASPFLAGAILAFVLNVPMRAIERGLKGITKPGLRRGLSILLTILAVVLVLTGVVYLLVPQIGQTVENLIATLPGFFQRTTEAAKKFLADNPEIWTWLQENTDFESVNWSGLIQEAVTIITGSLTTIVDEAFTGVINLGNGVFNAVLSLAFGLYCLARKEILARQGRRILYSVLPESAADETIRILRMSNSTFSNFISGQCLEALILGSMFAITMAIFGMPYIPLVSVVIAITALIPIVGAFAGCILGAFFILVDNPLQAVWFVVMFLILQQIEGNLIYPRVVGTSIGLPGMWVLVAVAVGGDLMGVGGMLLFIPLTSVLYALLREMTQKTLEKKGIPGEKLQDQPPELKSGFRERRKKIKERKQKQAAPIPKDSSEET